MTDALPNASPTIPAPVVGTPREWARDYGIVGAITGFAAPYVALGWLDYAVVAGVAGGLAGIVLGATLAWGIEGLRRRRVPIALLLAVAPVAGAVWGGVAGGLSGWLTQPLYSAAASLYWGAACGAAAGAVQLGWFGAGYVFLQVVGVRTTLWVALASVVGATLGHSFFALGDALSWFSGHPLAAGVLCAALVGGAIGIERAVRRARRSQV